MTRDHELPVEIERCNRRRNGHRLCQFAVGNRPNLDSFIVSGGGQRLAVLPELDAGDRFFVLFERRDGFGRDGLFFERYLQKLCFIARRDREKQWLPFW